MTPTNQRAYGPTGLLAVARGSVKDGEAAGGARTRPAIEGLAHMSPPSDEP